MAEAGIEDTGTLYLKPGRKREKLDCLEGYKVSKADIALIGLAVMGENLVLKHGKQGLYRGGIQ